MNNNILDKTDKLKILIIEDNPDIQEAASLIFELHLPEAEILQAYNGYEGMSKSKYYSPSIILLDLGLPDMDGLQVMKEIRSYSSVPVVILTVRGEEMDKVRGLELGADDYVVKPFGHKELLARIKAVLSRQQNSSDIIVDEQQKTTGTADDIKIDFNTGTASRNGNLVRFTGTEFALLRYLAGQNGKAVSESNILAYIWGEDYSDCGEYLQAFIKRLREKLGEKVANPRIILRDADGYRIAKEFV